jgi:hypothetical protein
MCKSKYGSSMLDGDRGVPEALSFPVQAAASIERRSTLRIELEATRSG